jgi:hypothetical protein
MDEKPDRAWRGRIRSLLYGMRLGGPVESAELDWCVEGELRRRRSGDDPEETYAAVAAALGSGAALAEDGQDEDAVRDALEGIVRRFDARRPWPPEPFLGQDVQLWQDLRTAPVVGRIGKSMKVVEAAFDLRAEPPEPGAGAWVLVVRMLSGRMVALREAGVWGAPTVELLSPAEPATVRAEIADATGLTVEAP